MSKRSCKICDTIQAEQENRKSSTLLVCTFALLFIDRPQGPPPHIYTLSCCSEIADGCHVFVVHICKRTTPTRMQPDANTHPPPLHWQSLETQLLDWFWVICSLGLFSLASGEIITLPSPHQFLPLSNSTLWPLLLLYLYCDADLKIGWGLGMGTPAGDGSRFSEKLWLVYDPGAVFCLRRWFGVGFGGLGWRGQPSYKHDSDIRSQHIGYSKLRQTRPHSFLSNNNLFRERIMGCCRTFFALSRHNEINVTEVMLMLLLS